METKIKSLDKLLAVGLIICFCLLGACSSSPIQSLPSDQSEKVTWLQANAISLNSVDISDTDFTDLQPMKEIIGDAKIVMLGEQTHGDGTTFLTKARLVKFLHQEMGFTVLAFESGLYDCALAWKMMNDGVEPAIAAQQGVFGIWSLTSQVKPLFAYMGSTLNSANPLELAGFDSQFTGNASRTYLIPDLESYLANNNSILINDERWSGFAATLDSTIQDFRYRPTSDARTQFSDFIHELQDEVSDQSADGALFLQSNAFWLQMLKSIEAQAAAGWNQNFSSFTAEDNNPRDLQMAKNLIWLSNDLYPDRKIIVWAATFHIMHNMNQIDTHRVEFTYANLVTMGHTVWQTLAEQTYALGFTAHQGSFRSIGSGATIPLDLPEEGSLEDFFNKAGFENAILDFRSRGAGGDWLTEQLISRPLGNAEMRANWTNILDGMVFNKHMVPSIVE